MHNIMCTLLSWKREIINKILRFCFVNLSANNLNNIVLNLAILPCLSVCTMNVSDQSKTALIIAKC